MWFPVTQCSSIFLLSLDGRWESHGETATVVVGCKQALPPNVARHPSFGFQQAIKLRPGHADTPAEKPGAEEMRSQMLPYRATYTIKAAEVDLLRRLRHPIRRWRHAGG